MIIFLLIVIGGLLYFSYNSLKVLNVILIKIAKEIGIKDD